MAHSAWTGGSVYTGQAALPHKNIQVNYATINELTVLSNLESHNAQMIREGMDKKDRFEALKEIAEYQLRVLNEAEKISNRIEEQ